MINRNPDEIESESGSSHLPVTNCTETLNLAIGIKVLWFNITLKTSDTQEALQGLIEQLSDNDIDQFIYVSRISFCSEIMWSNAEWILK